MHNASLPAYTRILSAEGHITDLPDFTFARLLCLCACESLSMWRDVCVHKSVYTGVYSQTHVYMKARKQPRM